MKKKPADAAESPPELLLAVLLHEMFLQWGYTKEEIKIEIHEEVTIIVCDGEKKLEIQTGKYELPKTEMESYRDFLLARWDHVPPSARGKVMLRKAFAMETYREMVVEIMERNGLHRHKVNVLDVGTTVN
jgi:hypothetical protein